MIGTDDASIEKYGRHIPPILGKQLVLNLVDQYLDNHQSSALGNEIKPHFDCTPSMERFHGALLFVDISGFTALSQRLNVDELRIHINGYFKKILDLVFKFNGEVIKFAGDALFIIWQTKSTVTDGADFLGEQYSAVAAATECGMEINETCSRYKVSFLVQGLNDSLLAGALINDSHAGDSQPMSPTSGPTLLPGLQRKETSTLLNVHAGVSVGTMAGIDVGANDRWEYLLVGEPLISVAKAESEAAVAELVLSPQAHSILHPFDAEFTSRGFAAHCEQVQRCYEAGQSIPLLPCGCQMTRGGFFKINQNITGGSNLNADDELDPEYELAFYAELMNNVTIAYDTLKPVIYENYNAIAVREQRKLIAEAQRAEAELAALGKSSPSADELANGHGKPQQPSHKRTLAQREVQLHSVADRDDVLFVHYLKWIQSCVMDDLVRHVHEADRHQFTFRHSNRRGCLVELALKNLNFMRGSLVTRESVTSNSAASTPVSRRDSLTHTPFGEHRERRASTANIDTADNFVSKIRSISNAVTATRRRQKKEKHERTLQQDAALTAELRNVIVLFIKLDVAGSLDLYFDPDRPVLEEAHKKERETLSRILESNHGTLAGCTVEEGNEDVANSEKTRRVLEQAAAGPQRGVSIEGFNFLKRTDRELAEDQRVLRRFQQCMEVMTSVFLEKGGQMRQFIVDDKGTVCIGTFGLRGSVSNDNAAAAVEVAQNIIDQLDAIGIKAGVGITSGKAYCGLVGSSQRHEYAVMGPSTNLSARLMGKATWGEILCSEEARNRDRTHNFGACGSINAKGYDQPVPIHKPVAMRHSVTGLTLTHLSPDKAHRKEIYPPSLNGSESPSTATHKGIPLSTNSADKNSVSISKTVKVSPAHGAHAKSKLRFHSLGREPEQSAIYAFAFAEVHQHFPTLSCFEDAISHNDTVFCQRVREAGLKLDTTHKAKLCIVQAGSGIGKSNFIHSFHWKVKCLQQVDAHLNLMLLQNKSSSFNSSEPLGAWKNILEQMLLSAAPIDHHNHLTKTKQDLILSGLHTLLNRMPQELVDLKPLLSSIYLVSGLHDNETTRKLTGSAKMNKICELLSALFQQYVNQTKKLVLVFMDDLQSIDSASWQLLKLLFATNSGLVLLSSYRPFDLEQHSSTNEEVLSYFEKRPAQCLKVVLKPFAEATTHLYCEHLMSMYGVTELNTAMYTTIHEISGGNPLYIYELTAAFVEKVKASPANDGTAIFNDMIKTFTTIRIEEVIFYRFDKLDPASQLLIKMASVVCANGAHFTTGILAAMMNEAEEPSDPGSSAASRRSSGLFRLSRAASMYGSCLITDDSSEIDDGVIFDLQQTIKTLLNRNEFIRVCAQQPEGNNVTPSMSESSKKHPTALRKLAVSILEENDDVDDEVMGYDASEGGENAGLAAVSDDWEQWNTVEFEFRVHLEQISVYALMLNDQKESLHDRVATYLEKKAKSGHGFTKTPSKASEVYEEGFHWEHAANWSAAMTAYYRSASLLESAAAFEESFVHLTAAYRMLNAMRRDCGVNEASINVPASFQAIFTNTHTKAVSVEDELAQMTPRSAAAQQATQFQPFASTLGPRGSMMVGNTRQSVSVPQVTALTRELIAAIFYNDSDLLEIGLQVLLRLGQASFNLSVNYAATSRLYEEALQIILLTWKDNIFDSGNNSAPSPRGNVSPSPSQMIRKTTRKGVSIAHLTEDFGLTDPTICFPILTGIAALYHNNRLKDDSRHTKEATMYSLFLTLAQSSPSYRMHLIVGYTYQRSICFDLNKLQESIHLVDIVRHHYEYDLYSSETARIYGYDRMPFTMALNVQLLLMLGQSYKARNYMLYISELYPRITHLHSLGITAFALCSVLVKNEMAATAYNLFRIYMDGLELKGTYSFFHETNPIFMLWLELEVTMEEYNRTGDLSLLESELDEREVLVQNAGFLCATPEARPMRYSALDSFGTSAEYVCAKICFLRARMWYLTSGHERLADIRAAMNMALRYINFNIECCQGEMKLAWGYFTSLIRKSEYLCFLASLLDKEEEARQNQLRAQAKVALMMCLDFGKQSNFLFICLKACVTLDQLGLDSHSEKLVTKYLSKIALSTHQEELSVAAADPSVAHEKYFKIGDFTVSDKIDSLIKLCPSLEGLKERVVHLEREDSLRRSALSSPSGSYRQSG